MVRGLAEDLLLLCWDDQQGAEHRFCWKTVDIGVAGALVAEAVLSRALAVEQGRTRPGGRSAVSPLLADVAAAVQRRAQPPRVRTLVDELSHPRTTRKVRDRLVAAGVLAPRRRRLLGVVPITRFPVLDADAAAAVRDEITALVTGQADPGEASPRQQVLVGLAQPVGALQRLVSESQRPAAEERAARLSPRDEVVTAVEASADHARAFLGAGAG